MDDNFTAKEIRREKNRAIRLEVYEWLQSIISALLACVLIFVFAARVIGVIGSSMEPTLYWGDKIIISNLFYTPQQGDIIVLRKDTFKDDPIVKRVIAVGGQTVDINFDEGVVYVDGVALEEDYVAEPTYREIDFRGEITVPDGCVFVLGDNCNASSDSRDNSIGCVDERYILGKAYLLILPGENPETEVKELGRIGRLYD